MKPWSFSPGFGYWASSVIAFRMGPLDALRNILLVVGGNGYMVEMGDGDGGARWEERYKW